MAAIICPSCNKPNADTLEICQFCGTPLKNRNTEPLPTIRPGEMPVKQQTSELESTLPSWLRDIRKGEGGEAAAVPAAPQQAKPETQKKKDDAPLDFLAGLSQANDDEEAEPDWLSSLKSDLPPLPTPAAEPQHQQPADWLAELHKDSQPEEPTDWLSELHDDSQPTPAASGQPSADWAFNDKAGEPAASEETPDWLTALKAQDTSVNAPAQPEPAETPPADMTSSSQEFPDWLNNLGGEPAAPVVPAPTPAPTTKTSPPADDLSSGADLPGWLSDMAQNTPVRPATAQPAPSADLSAAGDPYSTGTTSTSSGQVFPDWLANLGNESAPQAQQPSQPTPITPAAPVASQDSSLGGDFPDWLAGLASESPKTPAVEGPSSNLAATPNSSPADSDELPDWLGAAVEEKPSEKSPAPPSVAKKAFNTGALQELGPLGQPDQIPDWMAGLGSPTPAQTPQPAAPAEVPGADAFDWLSGLNQTGATPSVTEPKSTVQAESAAEKVEAAPVSFDISEPEEASNQASFPDSGSAQSLDSIFSMEMPDWLSGFTPSEPEAAKTTSEQPGPMPGNISPADLPSWVQAMRPIESVMSGTQNEDEDQTVEKEGPLAGLRSVLPALANTPGQRKPKAYSIKLQVDPTQMTQATLLENLIASEAESRPVFTTKQVVNIRPLRWIIALVLLLAVLVTAVLPREMGLQFFPLPELSDTETGDFYSLVDGLPDAAPVLVVFDYQPGYAGEMEQAAGPVIDHLMIKNARLAFVSTSPTGVLMNQRIMGVQNKLRKAATETTYDNGIQYIDLGYLPGDAAGIQVFAENPHILGNDYQLGNLWSPKSGLDKIKILSDFNMAIVLTDNPDTGRMWIEQTTNPLSGKPILPMLMVVSAQAAPMMRPYYDAEQIQGMVSGLAGGAVYEATTQRPGGNTDAYWVSYGAGMLAAEVLIVVGGIWALIQRLRTRRSEQEQDEDEA